MDISVFGVFWVKFLAKHGWYYRFVQILEQLDSENDDNCRSLPALVAVVGIALV